MKKNYFIILIIIGKITFSCAQKKETFSCINDSLVNYKVKNYLQINSFEKIDIESILAISVTKSDKNHFCHLLFFASLFNDAIEDGLDVNFDINKHWGPSTYDLNDELATEYAAINLQHFIYGKMIRIQKSYIETTINYYKNTNFSLLEKDVDSIIQNGFYKKPILLKDILLLKYKFDFVKEAHWIKHH